MNHKNIKIRIADEDDYEAFCQLMDQVDAIHRDVLPEMFKKPEGPVRELDYFSDLLSNQDICLFIAEAENEPMGLVHVMLSESPAIPVFVRRKIAVVVDLVVKSSYQRMGIGTSLMEVAHEWAQERGARAVELTVFDFNKNALALYNKLGYEPLRHRMAKPLKHVE
jgi:GNAT superfamily N-acetyltransferase